MCQRRVCAYPRSQLFPSCGLQARDLTALVAVSSSARWGGKPCPARVRSLVRVERADTGERAWEVLLQPAQHTELQSPSPRRQRGKTLLEILRKLLCYFNKTRHLPEPIPPSLFSLVNSASIQARRLLGPTPSSPLFRTPTYKASFLSIMGSGLSHHCTPPPQHLFIPHSASTGLAKQSVFMLKPQR